MSEKKEPEEIVLTEDEFWGAFRAAHLAGKTSPELDAVAKALNRAERELSNKAKTMVLDPFNIRGMSDPLIDGEAELKKRK